jgi:hypothetical protein
LRYDAFMRERINGKFVDKTTFFKVNISPFKVFIKESLLGMKIEGLYNQGFNNNKMLICTGGFPWVKMNLDPMGSKMRDNHHHTVFEAGFGYFISVISSSIEKNHLNLSKKISLHGTVEKNKRKCYKIILDNTDFHYYNYTIAKNENLTDLAKRLVINDYMILEKNPAIKDYKGVKEGTIVKVPSSYGKQMILYLDTELLLPVSFEIYDDIGLYAVYSYSNLEINPQFAWDEFNATFSGYHFK